MNTLLWSNRAVQHLRRGNASDAVLILLKAVFRLRKIRARVAAMQGPLEEYEDLSFIVSTPLHEGRKIHSLTPAQTALPLFDHAFVFSTTVLQDAHLWPMTYAIVLYNTGLALHIKGLAKDNSTRKDSNSQTQSLSLAKKFYKMALEILEAPSGGAAAPTNAPLLLLLALYNNLGQLQCHFYNVPEALECAECLKVLLIKGKSQAVLLPQQQSFFSLSVLTSSELTLAPAA